MDSSIAGVIAVRRATPLVVVEGNYLFLDTEPWSRVVPLLDASWFLTLSDDVRRERLVRRHREFGRSAADAEAWVHSVDDANATVIDASRSRAGLVVDTDDLVLPVVIDPSGRGGGPHDADPARSDGGTGRG